MSFKQTLKYSPNFDLKKRSKSQIKFLVFHYTGMKSDTEALNKVDIQLRNSYVITTKLISIDGSNYLNEIVFLLNNDKQNYTLKFNRRNFE